MNVPEAALDICRALANRRRATTAAVVLGCVLLLAGGTSGQKVNTTAPFSAAAWTADMHEYGYPDHPVYHQWIRLPIFHTDVFYLGDQEVIETFVTRELVKDLQRRADPHRALPLKLHAVVLDAASGKVQWQMAWSSDYMRVGLVPRTNGGFVVFLGDRLEFYSADFTFRSELKLPAIPVEETDLWFSSSPSGRTMLIRYTNEEQTRCVIVTGEAISVQQDNCELPARTAISDEEVVTAQVSKDNVGRVQSKISIKRLQEPWRTLCSDPGVAPCNNPEFVSEDTLLLWPGRGDLLRLVSDNGKTVFQAAKRGSNIVNSYSATTGLLVLPLYAPNARTAAFAAAEVFDVHTGKRIFEVEQGKGEQAIRDLQGLAISPAGDRLVIEGDGIVRCFDLPPRHQ